MHREETGLEHAALATFTDLSLSPNPYRGGAYEELAKHYEHRERNFAMALECVRAARQAEDSEALRVAAAAAGKKVRGRAQAAQAEDSVRA